MYTRCFILNSNFLIENFIFFYRRSRIARVERTSSLTLFLSIGNYIFEFQLKHSIIFFDLKMLKILQCCLSFVLLTAIVSKPTIFFAAQFSIYLTLVKDSYARLLIFFFLVSWFDDSSRAVFFTEFVRSKSIENIQ